MKVAGEYTFNAPRQEVWEGLLDPDVLAATMPGCEKLELTGENTYEGVLNIRVGPVQGKFQGKVQLEEIDPPNGYTMNVNGQGAPGFVRASAKIAIEPDGERTLMRYEGDAQVGGRIASVGQRLLDSSVKAIIRQSLEGLDKTLQARAAAGGGDEAAVVEVEAPSQAEFAAKVAKEVAKDLIPKPVLIGGIVLILAIVLYFVLR